MVSHLIRKISSFIWRDSIGSKSQFIAPLAKIITMFIIPCKKSQAPRRCNATLVLAQGNSSVFCPVPTSHSHVGKYSRHPIYTQPGAEEKGISLLACFHLSERHATVPTNSSHVYILAKIRKNKNGIVHQNNQDSLRAEPNKA